MNRRLVRALSLLLLVIVTALAAPAAVLAADSRLAPGFEGMPPGASIALMPPDVELYSLGVGGVPEPQAAWTEAAHRHLRDALMASESGWGLNHVDVSDADVEEFAEVSALCAAVARSIQIHYRGSAIYALPTKGGKLDWTLGDAVAPIATKTRSDYALFIWVRDSYATAERRAAFAAMALLGVAIPMGIQVGYATLVDLHTGQVVWFNQLARGAGDMRDPKAAAETLKVLLDRFPTPR